MIKLSDDAKLLEHGVDWLTCTAREPKIIKRLLAEGSRIIDEARDAGDDVRPFKWKGFEGWCVHGCDVGVRHDCGMVRVHGKTASDEWSNVAPLAQNWTRIDLQQTYRLADADVDVFLAKCWRSVKRTKLHGKPVSWHYRRDASHGDTLEIGRRQSEKFGRIYNKARESRMDHYVSCLRFEAEFKGDVAWSITKDLIYDKHPAMAGAACLRSFMLERGVSLRPLSDRSSALICYAKPADVDRYIGWLRKCVSSGVKSAVERRGLEAVVDALGLSALVAPKTPRSE